MQVVIIGAGEVGTAIAKHFAGDNDVTVIDMDESRAEKVKYEIDAMTLAADGTSMATLETADVGEADIFLACTDDDRANLVACGTAKTLGDAFTIARSKSVEYLRTWERTEEAFGVDFMVCSDLLTAENIVRVIGLPSSIDVDPFAGGLVNMAEFEVPDGSPISGETVAEADRFESMTFVGIFRNDHLLIPSGDTVIESGDRAVVIGSPESVNSFAGDLVPDATPDSADEIVIIGGSEIGYHTARLLENNQFEPRLIEEDHERARYLAEELPGTLVMEHEATDTEFLAREHVDEADIVVAAMDSDERNLLISVLSKRLGVDRVIALVDNAEYVSLFEEIGIDVAINPRRVTAEEITRFSFDNVAENLAVLEDDRAEVLEIELDEDSNLVGRSIQELAEEIDGQFVIGAVTRDRRVITPRGDTVLEVGDHIVVFVETGAIESLTSFG